MRLCCSCCCTHVRLRCSRCCARGSTSGTRSKRACFGEVLKTTALLTPWEVFILLTAHSSIGGVASCHTSCSHLGLRSIHSSTAYICGCSSSSRGHRLHRGGCGVSGGQSHRPSG